MLCGVFQCTHCNLSLDDGDAWLPSFCFVCDFFNAVITMVMGQLLFKFDEGNKVRHFSGRTLHHAILSF